MNDLIDFLNKGDRFAATNGMQLTEVREGYARAEWKPDISMQREYVREEHISPLPTLPLLP